MLKVSATQEGMPMPTVELFSAKSCPEVRELTAEIQALGIRVIGTTCPPSTADWVRLPFLRANSGSSYFGRDGIDSFIQQARRHAPRTSGA